MRRRPSARLLVLNREDKVLLFRFVYRNSALIDQDYWATPGGALNEGESFEQAAVRELEEETGLRVKDVGDCVGRNEFVLPLRGGEKVLAEERFYLVRTEGSFLSRAGWKAHEREVMTEHKWWSRDELARTTEKVWPENLAEMLGEKLS